MLVPLIAVVLFLALYPQLALHRSEGSVKGGRWRPRRVASGRAPPRVGRPANAAPTPAIAVSPPTSRGGAPMSPLLAVAHLRGPHIDFGALSPLIALLGGAVVVLCVGMLGSGFARRTLVPVLSLVVLGTALGLTIWQWQDPRGGGRRRAAGGRPGAGAEHHPDRRRRLRGAAGVALAGRREAAHGEFHALLLTSLAGMSLLASAQNTVILFVGLELLSIPLYVLCATEMRREHSLESGLKYLIIGSVGSATLLYGLAMIYGATGHTDFSGIAHALSKGDLAPTR